MAVKAPASKRKDINTHDSLSAARALYKSRL
jgi:hypothetical protein